MSLEEFEQAPDKKTKRYLRMRSITDFGMGFIYVCVGIAVLLSRQFNFQNEFTMSIPAKIFAVLAIVYGAWRIYRGIKKDYLKKQ